MLRPRARILRTFGDELISSSSVAVLELVKNAYDADATSVVVRFRPPVDVVNEGSIDVVDNGHGMSLETIEATWMEPATQHRRRNPHSETLGRRVLGEKGIGRFATSRLANGLEVITRRVGEDVETHVVFDWSAFDEDRYLDEVEARYWQQEPEQIVTGSAISSLDDRFEKAFTHGTILRMTGIREAWTPDLVKDLRNALARLISPFEYEQAESSFHIGLQLPDPYSELSGRVEPPELLRRPQYSIAGEVLSDGKYDLAILLPGKRAAQRRRGRFIVDGQPPTVGPFRIELRVWDRDAATMRRLAATEGTTVGSVRSDLDLAAGVNVYRDGFRVLPYGEPRNDWLRLDLRRVQNPTMRLSNNQVVGYVLISADANPELRDQSNREGLIENRAYNDLTNLIVQVFGELEQRRYEARRPNVRRTQGGLFEGFSLDAVRSYARRQYPGDEQLRTLLEETAGDLGRRVEEAQDVIARYRSLATLGQLIDTVLHDGRAPVAKIGNESRLGLRDIERNLNGELVPKLGDRLLTIRTQSDVLGAVFKKIEPFGGRRRGRPKRIPIEGIIADAFDVLDTEIERLGVEVDLPKSENVVSVDPAELEQIILNLLQNSLWWLRDMTESERKIAVQVRRGADRLDIIFADSGPGVSSEVADRIFDPYFSTKPNGVGLGLTIAGEIASDYYDGALELLDHGPLPGATFRVRLRRRI